MTQAAILIIGNEVLSGKVDDTNSGFLIRALRERGVHLAEIRVIPDVLETIVAAVRELAARFDVVFTTGGIGPTHDDITIHAVARAFDRAVVHHPELLRRLRDRYGDDLNDARHKLAEIPEGGVVRANDDNPITVVQFDNLYILPGVPSLMRLCFERIADDLGESPLFSQALYLDVSESDAAAPVAQVQSDHADVAVGSYPRFDNAPYRVKITVDGQSRDAVEDTIADLRRTLDPAWLVDIDGE